VATDDSSVASALPHGDLERMVARLVADPYPPYQFEDDGRIRGIDQEIIQEAFALQGIHTSTVLLPWKECLQWMDQGKADGIFQMAPSEERKKIFLFSEKLRTEQTILFARSGGAVKIQGGRDIRQRLAGRTLGVLEGYSYGPDIDDFSESMKLKAGSQEALLAALAGGKADLVLIDAGVALYLAGKMGVTGIEQVEGYAIERPLHVAFLKRHHQLADLFNTGLQRVKTLAIDQRIFEDYGVRP
jgi:polar amino acid transport system substrate-binding protein